MSTVTATVPLIKQTFAAGTSPSDLQFRLRSTATAQIIKTKTIAASALPPIPAGGEPVSASVDFLDVPDGGYEMLIQRLQLVSGIQRRLGTEIVIPFAVPGTAVDALVVGDSSIATITVTA